ncbi:MAG: glycoside hydrolase family 3 N-terminal domain-containing protein [Bacteroidota bacterium]
MNLAFLVSCQKPTKSPEAYETNPSLTDADLGQLLMVGFRGQEIDSVSALVKEQLRSGEIGHTILFDFDYVNKVFDRNIVSVAQVQQYLRDIQALAPAPMFKAIDQEGGRVLRLKPDYGYATLPSAQYLGELNDVDSTRFYGKVNAQQLQNSGFNVNFAPVVDLNVNPENPVIGGIERSFGATTEQVVQHAAAWIQPHADAGVLSVLKHFPGHGSSQADSHKGIADVTASWTEEELRPFKLLLDSVSLTAVMTAHVFNRSIDSIYPATLSPHYIKSMLREDISYEGIVFSDDMHMKAVSAEFGFKTAIRQAILAGVDVLVFGNNLEYDESVARTTIATLRELLAEGAITEARLRQSIERVRTTLQKM